MEKKKIKIINSSEQDAWYASCLGDTFSAYELKEDYVLQEDYDAGYSAPWRHIDKQDVAIVGVSTNTLHKTLKSRSGKTLRICSRAHNRCVEAYAKHFESTQDVRDAHIYEIMNSLNDLQYNELLIQPKQVSTKRYQYLREHAYERYLEKNTLAIDSMLAGFGYEHWLSQLGEQITEHILRRISDEQITIILKKKSI